MSKRAKLFSIEKIKTPFLSRIAQDYPEIDNSSFENAFISIAKHKNWSLLKELKIYAPFLGRFKIIEPVANKLYQEGDLIHSAMIYMWNKKYEISSQEKEKLEKFVAKSNSKSTYFLTYTVTNDHFDFLVYLTSKYRIQWTSDILNTAAFYNRRHFIEYFISHPEISIDNKLRIKYNAQPKSGTIQALLSSALPYALERGYFELVWYLIDNNALLVHIPIITLWRQIIEWIKRGKYLENLVLFLEKQIHFYYIGAKQIRSIYFIEFRSILIALNEIPKNKLDNKSGSILEQLLKRYPKYFSIELNENKKLLL